jgi:hypothetical protein
MRRQEIPHNTPEQIKGYLDEAYRIVAESPLPEELHAVVLPEIIRLVASKQIVMEQATMAPMMAIPGQRH